MLISKRTYICNRKGVEVENQYPLLCSALRGSSKLSIPLYRILVIIPSGFDKVTWTIPLSITTCKTKKHTDNRKALTFLQQHKNPNQPFNISKYPTISNLATSNLIKKPKGSIFLTYMAPLIMQPHCFT